jgi:hypothetical protein
MLGKFRLVGSGLVGTNYKMFLDDIEITHFVRKAEICIEAGCINTVLLYASIEVPEEFEALITIYGNKDK